MLAASAAPTALQINRGEAVLASSGAWQTSGGLEWDVYAKGYYERR
jgi:hypothetical protein